MTKDDQHVDDILIVGSGLNGLMVALTMANVGANVGADKSVPVHVIDRQDGTPVTDPIRTTTINPATYQHLAGLGVWDEYTRRHQSPTPITHIRVSDDETKPRPGRMVNDSLIDWTNDHDGAPLAYTFQNKAMVDSLYHLASAHENITMTTGCSISQYHQTHPKWGDAAAMVSSDDGQSFAARLIIAADGGQSPIRQSAGLRGITRQPGQTAIVANVTTEKPHEQMAWQRFINGGPAALMPIDDDKAMSLVWTVNDDNAALLLAADPHAFNAALMESFGTGLGALRLTSERLSWPLKLHHTLKPHAQRLVLVGDAAHAIHPLAGQGYNLGVGDAVQLAALISDAKRTGQDIGTRHVLRQYSAKRAPEVAAMTMMTDGLNAAFSFAGSSPIGAGAAALTGIGMTLFGASPLKKWAERFARG